MEYIIQWRMDYPGTRRRRSVFINYRGTLLRNEAAIAQLRVIGKRAGIEKRLTPHLFRHSRITHMVQEGVSECDQVDHVGFGPFQMLRTYAHLTGQDIERELRRSTALKTRKERRRSLLSSPMSAHTAT